MTKIAGSGSGSESGSISQRHGSADPDGSATLIGTKPKRFDLVRLLSEQKQNVFNLFQNYLKSNRNVLAFFIVQKRNPNETELISYQIETFPYTYASKETKRNFCELFPNFSTSSELFCLLQAA